MEAAEGHAVQEDVWQGVDERNDLRRRLENANILIEHLEAEKAEMLEALEWYAEKVLNCRKITAEGNAAKRAVLKQIAKLKSHGRLRRVGPAKGGYWEVIE